MSEGCCDRACKCCAVPKYSIALTLVTVLFLGIHIAIAITSIEVEECESDSLEHCYEDEDLCGDGRCTCLTLLDVDRGPYCRDKDIHASTAVWVLAILTLIVGVLFLVLSFVSCCCFGCLSQEQGVYMGYPMVGSRVAEAEMMKL